MIDILKAKEAFKEYVKAYNPDDGKIALKIGHTYRTTDVAKNIAISLNLADEDIDLAELIGLLHDIGRFEQLRRYNTYSDRDSINHAEFGVQLLFEERLIRKFIEDEKYDEIIYKAIINHNRKEIDSELTNRELLHAKIIRDADKTDIFNVLVQDKIENIYCVEDMSNEVITPEVMDMFLSEEHIVDYAKMKCAIDNMVAHFAYVFDFNFDYGLKVIKDRGSLEKLYNKVDFKNPKTKEQMEIVYKVSKTYVDERLK